MKNEEKIKEFLNSNIDTFLSDILQLPPKERAKAFLELMSRNEKGTSNLKIEKTDEELNKEIEEYEKRNHTGIAPIEWINEIPKTEKELEVQLAKLRAERIKKENEGREKEDYLFSKGRLNDMDYELR